MDPKYVITYIDRHGRQAYRDVHSPVTPYGMREVEARVRVLLANGATFVRCITVNTCKEYPHT